jgi:TIR domain
VSTSDFRASGSAAAQEPSAHDGFVYDAFISYSRKNSDVADKIERDLQNFPLTREIRKRLGRRRLNIFRDVNDLTGNRLTSALEQNLEQSRTLVVLCSPAARGSTYVGLEINRFAQLRDASKIVPVLIAGVPNNERDSDPAEWAFPDALADTLGEGPLAPDLRRAWEAKRRRARLAQGSPWIQLVAGIVDVRPDDLTERIARAERRRLQGIFGGLLALLVVVSTLAVFAWTQRNNAVEQSLIATTRQLAATAKTAAETDLQPALLLADTAYRTSAEPQTIDALHAVVTTTPQLEGFYDFGQPVTAVDGTPDARILVGGTESGTVYRLDRATGPKTEVMALDVPIEFMAVSDDGETIAATGVRYDENSLPELTQSALWREGELNLLPGKRIGAMSPSGRTIAVWFNDDTLELVVDGERTTLVPADRAAWVELPSDAAVVTMSGDGRFIRAAVDGSSNETTQIPMGMSRVGGTISPNGARFTYISQGLENEVWDLAGPLTEQTGAAAFAGQTGNARSSAIALSYNGTRMATAAEGAIFISDVQPIDELSWRYTELRGAGKSPHSLRFLSDDVILSASGSSAALWDLRKETPLATRVPAEVGSDCGACGPPRVIVSPDARKALIANNVLPGTSLVDLTTGGGRSITFGAKEGDADLDAPPAMVWLDAKRVFAYAANGDAWILTGDQLDVIEREFSLPAVGTVTRTVLRDDGTVVLATEHGLVRVNPDTGEAVETGVNAGAVTTDGTYAVNFTPENGQENSTAVEIIDIASGQKVKKVIDGALLTFVEHTDGNLALLRRVGGRSGDTEVLLLDPRDGTVRSVEPLGDLSAATSPALVSSADAVYVDEAVEIGLYSMRNDLRLSFIPVESGHRAFNLLGLNRDGTILVAASQSTQSVLRVPVTAEAWSALACKSAGRQLHPAELESIVKSTDRLTAGCGGPTTR